jgi:hypothetical protein
VRSSRQEKVPGIVVVGSTVVVAQAGWAGCVCYCCWFDLRCHGFLISPFQIESQASTSVLLQQKKERRLIDCCWAYGN